MDNFWKELKELTLGKLFVRAILMVSRPYLDDHTPRKHTWRQFFIEIYTRCDEGDEIRVGRLTYQRVRTVRQGEMEMNFLDEKSASLIGLHWKALVQPWTRKEPVVLCTRDSRASNIWNDLKPFNPLFLMECHRLHQRLIDDDEAFTKQEPTPESEATVAFRKVLIERFSGFIADHEWSLLQRQHDLSVDGI